jgi:2,4-dienoyl-CoA reductase-like NADH-dependent reductase (Old Yellow Enzyme family)
MIHGKGTPVVIQINHAGKRIRNGKTETRPASPSPAKKIQGIEFEEIEGLSDSFGNAAERAMRAGFDGVEIHGAHGFLLNQFYSPLTNHRHDKYGGSLDNRMRFPLEVVRKVKEKVGGRLLLYRIGSDDLDPRGTRIEDSQRLAAELQESGVDIIDVSGGLCGSRPPQLQGVKGFFVPQAQKIREAVEVPIIGVGGIRKPEYADRLVQEEIIDLVAVGRGLLRDPDWAIKAMETLTKD